MPSERPARARIGRIAIACTVTVVAPRLFVIPARDAPVAAVFRRGPSDWCQVLRWRTDRDEVDDGAWFRGRLYEAKCDVSPDGELLVVAAFQGSRLGTGYTDSWTAVSRLPWLHALALWPVGTTYGGGGRFTGPRSLTLRLGDLRAHPDHPAHGLELTTGAPPRHASTDEIPDADWCGRDHAGRLLLARAGRLYRRRGHDDVQVLDARDRHPAPAPAPGWAKTPLR